jgi:hypothetical protein
MLTGSLELVVELLELPCLVNLRSGPAGRQRGISVGQTDIRAMATVKSELESFFGLGF